MIKFRSLTENDVECRVSQLGTDWCTLLLYKNARVDMNILDETVGPENWQRDHFDCKGNLYCKIGINTNYKCADAPDRWVWKADCGTESYTEKEKGESSDSFKRAGFCWGIGRELYTAPLIFIRKDGKDGKPNYETTMKNGKETLKGSFEVTKMIVKDGKITGLNIEYPRFHKTVFVFGNIFDD